jgi:hypothetical protein
MPKKLFFAARALVPGKNRIKIFNVCRFYDTIFKIMETKELRKLVEKYSVAQIEACILQQVSKGANECDLIDNGNEVITELSEAEVVRELMDEGRSFSEALRELGRRIRAVYGKEE